MMQKVGVQLYTIRQFMETAEQIKESFEKLKKMGYDQVQTAGCKIPYDQFGQIAKDAGLEIVGTHENFQKLCEDPQKAIENHKALDTKTIGIGGFFGPTGAQDYYDFIEKANKLAATINKEGYKFSYHNHSHEFIKYDGKTAMEILADGLDPQTTSFVLDTYWVQHGGASPAEWIEKLAGRIDILHLKDMGRNEEGPFITEIGNGNINFKTVLDAAEKAGVKYYVVEQDICPGDPFDSLQISMNYIKAHLI